MKIDTKNVGDVYVLKKESAYTEDDIANVKINGYNYVSQMIMTKEQIKEKMETFEEMIMM